MLNGLKANAAMLGLVVAAGLLIATSVTAFIFKLERDAALGANEALGKQVADANAAIRLQNEAVSALKKAGEARVAAIDAASRERAQIASELRKTIEGIKAAPVPKDCDGAMAWLAREAPAVAW